MSRFFNDSPPRGSFAYVPTGKANCKVNELIHIDGETFRNPIGEGYSATPIEAPIILDTVYGNLEVLNMPPLDGFGLPEMPLSDGAFAKAKTPDTNATSTLH
jgi:hypothetical protein